ncbi:MAG: hypothetical protein QGI75_00285 [Phycisphaerales bacterium]|jgi:type II secretory pathway pseudopilin PulG|nr:hypothetical protein [Phycisphaerales bacterium]
MTMRRGAMLLEVLVSLAIVVGVSAFALQAVGGSEQAIDRADRRRRCMDVAASVAGMLDAGLIGVGDLRSRQVPEVDGMPLDEGATTPLELEATTERTQWGGIVLLTLIVSEGEDAIDPVQATLRQLVLLREHRAEELKEDDLLEGLE